MKRYPMMSYLVDKDPLSAEQFAEILKEHALFIETGGGEGHWETFVAGGGLDTGITFGVYIAGFKGLGARGKQAALSHKRFSGLDLRGVNFSFADLSGVWAEGQDLEGADLSGSLVIDAFFAGANLRRANLRVADFSRCDLTGCDLRGANLYHTDFEQADLTHADLTGANLEGARFVNTCLKGVKGME